MKEELYRILWEAGEIMLSAESIRASVTDKEGPHNFVTRYDVAVQRLLRERLLALRPQAHFLGEEEEARDDVAQGEAFIVDPIDGTTNFIHGFNTSAVSVAYLQNGQVVTAAVLDPYRREFFYAERGKGAFCNDRPLQVSGEDLKHSVVCAGTAPYYPEETARTFALAAKMLTVAVDLRRSGSAVLDLCQLARGAAGLFFETKLSPWDYAACSLLITEAGGVISQMDGAPLVFDRPISVLAGTPRSHADFLEQKLYQVGLEQDS